MTYNMKNQNAPKHPLPRQRNPATQRMLHTGQVTSVREHASINIPCTHVPQNSFLKSAVASVRRLQSLLGERGKESSEGESGQVQQLEVAPSSPSPLASPSNHASIDGMDSVYANALRRSASYCLLLSNSGPFRQSVLIRSSRSGTPPRRSRGGAKKYARRRLSESPLSLSMEHAMVGMSILLF